MQVFKEFELKSIELKEKAEEVPDDAVESDEKEDEEVPEVCEEVAEFDVQAIMMKPDEEDEKSTTTEAELPSPEIPQISSESESESSN